jgi:Pectate lyase superfamily protein
MTYLPAKTIADLPPIGAIDGTGRIAGSQGAVRSGSITLPDLAAWLAPRVNNLNAAAVINDPTGFQPSGGVARSVAGRLAETVSVADYGAVGDGVHDDTAAVQAAIAAASALANASYGGAEVVFAGKQYKITGTLTILANFITLVGQGPQGTMLIFSGMGNIDWITFGSSSVSVRRGGLRNLGIWGGSSNAIASNADGSVSGAAVKLTNAYDMMFDRVATENVLCGFDVGPGTNNIQLRGVVIVPNQAGSLYGINWHCPGDGSARSDVLRVDAVTIEGQWSNAIGLNWQGFCNTLVGSGLRILHMNTGIKVSNPAASGSYYPSFLNISDLELEGFKYRALDIRAGSDFKITNSDINNLTAGVAAQGSADDYAVYMAADVPYSYAHGLSITNSRIGGCQKNGLYFAGRDLQLDGVIFYTTSYAGSGAHSVIRLASTTVGANITNIVAEEFGGAGRASYGVQVDSGAQRVLVVNMDASACTAGAVSDATNAASAINIIAPGGTLQGLYHFPAAGMTQTRATTNGVLQAQVYNLSTGASAIARDGVATGTGNSYVIRDLKDNSGAPYYQEAGGSAVTLKYTDFPQHFFRTATGTNMFSIGAALPSYANDSAAATGGVPLYGYYQTSGAVKQRLT